MNTLSSKYIFLALATSISFGLVGCNTYFAGHRWRGVGVVVAAPPPRPRHPYPYEYYYAPAYQAYYCYYPNYGWVYQPGPPPPNAVFWNGPVPYLGPPGPPTGVYFYFDQVRHVYYYRGGDGHWMYYHGLPPLHARFWNGLRPRLMPEPPRGAPRQYAPRRYDQNH